MTVRFTRPAACARVHIGSTALADLRGVARLFRAGARPSGRTFRQLASFGAIGMISTIVYAVLFSLLRGGLPAAAANLVALAVTTVGNTTANRRLTFAVRGRSGLFTDHLAGLASFGVALALTTAAIGLLGVLKPGASVSLEIGVAVAANAIATVVRFFVLRSRLDRPGPATTRMRLAPETAGR